MGMAAAPLTISEQDYLKVIYELTAEGGPATTNAIAARLGISAASVTGMLQKMATAKPALVTYRKHQGVHLTAGGHRAALEIIRHHRLIETWLVRTLGYSWDDVHREAEQLEHVMSEDLEKRIADALGNPDRDPHGEPIPSADLVMPRDSSIPLSELRPGQAAMVRRAEARDTGALRRLDEAGVRIGTIVKVLARSDYDQLVTLHIRGQSKPVTLGPALTGRVYVERPRATDKDDKEKK